jgi:predicted RNase H-like HicB family nuclease
MGKSSAPTALLLKMLQNKEINMPNQAIYANDSERSSAKPENWQTPQETYRIYILTDKDEDGVYSTIALNLPGSGSCGDTPEESVQNAKEAIRAVLEEHIDSGVSIPWKDAGNVIGAKWITIHV